MPEQVLRMKRDGRSMEEEFERVASAWSALTVESAATRVDEIGGAGDSMGGWEALSIGTEVKVRLEAGKEPAMMVSRITHTHHQTIF